MEAPCWVPVPLDVSKDTKLIYKSRNAIFNYTSVTTGHLATSLFYHDASLVKTMLSPQQEIWSSNDACPLILADLILVQNLKATIVKASLRSPYPDTLSIVLH